MTARTSKKKKSQIIDSISKFVDEFPKYSFGDIWYAISRKLNSESCNCVREISEDDINKLINEAIKIEKED